MKKIIRLLFSVCAITATLLALGISAQAEREGDYDYTVTACEATITYCYSSSATVSIPSTLGGYPVTAIGNGKSMFSNYRSLNIVIIPSSVTSIDSAAFSGCNLLQEIRVDKNSTTYCNDEKGVLYNKAKTQLIKVPLSNGGNYTIPDSVTSIGKSAFSGCSGLTTITIPNSVTSIGESAFSGCSGLKSVTIPDSVTSIDDSMFSNCSGLKSVTIPNSVTSIGNKAFRNCDNLTSITIPDSVTSIGASAFSESDGLKNVTISDSVTSIGNCAFYGCSRLTRVIIGSGLTSIGSSAFGLCYSLTSIQVSESNISYYSDKNGVLYNKTKTRLILVPRKLSGDYTVFDGVTSIDDSMFYSCSELTSITIPDSVTSIGDDAFFNCSGLTSVTIPDSVTSIGDQAFAYCHGLKNVTIPDSVTSIGYYAFYSDKATKIIWFLGNAPSAGSTFIANIGGTTVYYPSGNTTYDKFKKSYTMVTWVEYTHEWSEWIITKDSTQTEQGTAEHTCTNTNHYKKESIELPALIDTAVWTIGETIPANCTQDGSQSYNSIYGTVTEIIPAGHNWGNWAINIKPTQSTQGMAKRICANDSNHTEIIKLPALTDTSVWTVGETIPANCTQDGGRIYISEYGTVTEVETPATGHSWSEWTITQNPSSAETGTAERVCNNDNSHTETVALPVLSDTSVWSISETIPVTCTKDGIRTYTSKYGTITKTIASTGKEHNWGEWTTLVAPTVDSPGMAERVCANNSSHTELKELPVLTTPYISAVIRQGGIDVTVKNIPQGCNVILALYKDGRFVALQTKTYNGENLQFDTTVDYDSYKVMGWGNIGTMQPLCDYYGQDK